MTHYIKSGMLARVWFAGRQGSGSSRLKFALGGRVAAQILRGHLPHQGATLPVIAPHFYYGGYQPAAAASVFVGVI